MVVGRLETTRKSGSEIGFVREYLSIHQHNALKGGPRAMPGGVCQGRLCINAPCVSAEWHEQEGFLRRKMSDGCSRVGEGRFPR